MEDPQQPRLEVGEAPVGVDQPRLAAQGDRHRVDREVAAAEVRLDVARRADLRQGPRARVGLRTGGGDVEHVAVHLHLGRREALVLDQGLGTELGGKLGGVPHHHEVDVGPAAAEQQVANRAADDVDGRAGDAAQGAQLRIGAAQRLGEVLDRRHGARHLVLPYHDRLHGWPTGRQTGPAGRTREGRRWSGAASSSGGPDPAQTRRGASTRPSSPRSTAGYTGATTEIPGYATRDSRYELARFEILGSSGVSGLAADLRSGT